MRSADMAHFDGMAPAAPECDVRYGFGMPTVSGDTLALPPSLSNEFLPVTSHESLVTSVLLAIHRQFHIGEQRLHVGGRCRVAGTIDQAPRQMRREQLQEIIHVAAQ